jgi:hypothetical protein
MRDEYLRDIGWAGNRQSAAIYPTPYDWAKNHFTQNIY